MTAMQDDDDDGDDGGVVVIVVVQDSGAWRSYHLEQTKSGLDWLYNINYRT